MSQNLLRPLADRVLIKPVEAELESAAGLVLLSDSQPEQMGTVVAVGPGVYCDQCRTAIQGLRGSLRILMLAIRDVTDQLDKSSILRLDGPLARAQRELAASAITHRVGGEVHVGDLVVYSNESGQDVEMDGIPHLMMRASEILAVVTEEQVISHG